MGFFNLEDCDIYWSIKEGTFNSGPYSEGDNNGVGDGDGGDYMALPVKMEGGYIWISKPLHTKHHVHGQGPDEGYVKRHGRELPVKIRISGKLWNFNMLHQMVKASTTTGPASSIYTHTYVTTTARGTPSFQIYLELGHGTDPIAWEFMGCIVTSWEVSWSQNNTATLTLDIQAASQNLVDDSSYHYIDTNVPSSNASKALYSSDLVTFSWKKGGSAIDGRCKAFTFRWNDGYKIDRYHASNVAIKKGPREISVNFTWEPEDTEAYDEAVAAVTDRDIDIDIEFVRTAGEDECKINMEKLAWEDFGVGDISDYTWEQDHTLLMNPAETGKKVTITQKNTLTDEFYANV